MTDQSPTTANPTFLDGQNAAYIDQLAAESPAHLGEAVITAIGK